MIPADGDDIVTRLREEALYESADSGVAEDTLYWQAAAEIERLRAEIKTLWDEIRSLKSTLDSDYCP